MAYIETQAFIFENGRKREATSKADIKRALTASPATVLFESLDSPFTPFVAFTGDAFPVDLPHSFTVTISPYVKRSGFGTVTGSRKVAGLAEVK